MAKLTKTLQQVQDLVEGITQCGELRGAKFAYGLNKNLGRLESELRALMKAQQAPPECADLLKAEHKLAQQHAERDAKGRPVYINKAMIKLADPDAFTAARRQLHEEHPEAAAALEKHRAEIDELLQREITIDIHKIKPDDLPDNISAEQLAGIMDLIE